MADNNPAKQPEPHLSQPPKKVPKPSLFQRPFPIHRWTGTLLGASMWFWLMYRAKKDGPALLGLRHPWDH
ncbi:MAG: hypothetical protein M1816_005206 [Peltula sp. TS41687]|nr:MAG: hypothetical protein M1816_005206 [Peltula sp. TS41687]